VIVQYGSYQHKINSTGISISQEVEENEQGLPHTIRTTINIEGRIHRGPSTRFPVRSQDLDPFITGMQAAYSIPGQDFGLLHNDGGPSEHYWKNDKTLGGIRAKMMAFPNWKGGEYATYRSFQIQVQFEEPYRRLEHLRFSETISIEGGGERYGVKEVNNGPGVRQRLRTHTMCKATQQGIIVSRGSYPKALPLPIWPFALVDQRPKIQKAVRPRGGQLTEQITLNECEISYSYEYEWPQRLDGFPTYSLGGED
jgi:hypothetical protein